MEPPPPEHLIYSTRKDLIYLLGSKSQSLADALDSYGLTQANEPVPQGYTVLLPFSLLLKKL